ncbi:MAG: response regulator [Rariglobus sp.]|nr:response regulator [Rariglobus sp.]
MSSLPPPSRVLIADDSIVCRDVLVILLKTSGYDVVSVFDGAEAVQALRTQSFDLAILDNDMPNLGGIGALTQLRSFLPKLPVVVCSGTVTESDAVHYRQLGIDDLLKKPVDPRALRDRVAQILSRRTLQSQTSASTAPFLVGKSAIESPSSCALIAGGSSLARNLQADLERLRQFRSVALIEGRHGSGRFELALQASPASGTHTFVCHPDALDAAHLDQLLKPALADASPVMLVVLEADQLSAGSQTLLEELVRGRLTAFAGLSKRLRVTLCSERTLSDLHFNEFLLLRAGTATYEIPDFAARREDWCEIARTILRRSTQARGALTSSAAKWIEQQTWPGDYMQFHRTVELARKISGAGSMINDAHLIEAVTKEHEHDAPLYHDLLFDQYSGT